LKRVSVISGIAKIGVEPIAQEAWNLAVSEEDRQHRRGSLGQLIGQGLIQLLP
jgi:hypothetical protein